MSSSDSSGTSLGARVLQAARSESEHLSWGESEEARVIRDDDASHPVAVSFDHVYKSYKLYKTFGIRLFIHTA